MQATKDKVVRIDYTLKDDDGTVLDTSEGREPVSYLHGVQTLVPGLENALEGQEAGNSLRVTVPPAQGYGDRDPGRVAAVPKENFPPQANIEVGVQFQAETPDGPQVVTVVEVTEEEVTVDANHPLAGKTLHFDVKVLDVRDATAEEIEHGHAHGPGGHHHEED